MPKSVNFISWPTALIICIKASTYAMKSELAKHLYIMNNNHYNWTSAEGCNIPWQAEELWYNLALQSV